MKLEFTWRSAALALAAFQLGIGLATPAVADDKVVKIGVLTDMASLYADINGPNTLMAVKMAVEDSGLRRKAGRST